jgi:hypothetical protein
MAWTWILEDITLLLPDVLSLLPVILYNRKLLRISNLSNFLNQ